MARIYDHFLGGKDNFASDRDAAGRLTKVVPTITGTARANRAFVQRAVRHAAVAGITQFLDLGCGMPRRRNVHEIAAMTIPDARTVYVDNDPAVLMHARAILAADGTAAAVPGDIRTPDALFKDPVLLDWLDVSRPVVVLLAAVLHHVDDPAGVVTAVRERLAPGSWIVISHACRDAVSPAALDVVKTVYAETGTPITPRPFSEILALFDGLGVVDPGVVEVSQWRPGDGGAHHGTAQAVGGAGICPGGQS
ncbi:SAM-dependent methyltransferase [Planomonospora sp. ID67723]|nr:SAM-dependent methyltransferase [Planomonospora sp. ID67723]